MLSFFVAMTLAIAAERQTALATPPTWATHRASRQLTVCVFNQSSQLVSGAEGRLLGAGGEQSHGLTSNGCVQVDRDTLRADAASKWAIVVCKEGSFCAALPGDYVDLEQFDEIQVAMANFFVQ